MNMRQYRVKGDRPLQAITDPLQAHVAHAAQTTKLHQVKIN